MLRCGFSREPTLHIFKVMTFDRGVFMSAFHENLYSSRFFVSMIIVKLHLDELSVHVLLS